MVNTRTFACDVNQLLEFITTYKQDLRVQIPGDMKVVDVQFNYPTIKFVIESLHFPVAEDEQEKQALRWFRLENNRENK